MSDNQTGVYAAVAAVMGELAKEGISKDRRATGVATYNFRGIDDVYNALAALLSKHKLVILPRVLSRVQQERQTKSGGVIVYTVVEVEYDIVCATDGSRHTVRTIGEAMDTSDKSTNKAMSAAYKYMAFQAFCIPTEGDNDADATSDPLPPKGQTNRPAQQRKDPPPSQNATGTPFDDAPRADLCVPVPLDAEASGSDWKLWATTLLPDRLRVCRNADEVDSVVKANLDALNTLKSVSPQAHKALMNSATKRAEFFIEKEAA